MAENHTHADPSPSPDGSVPVQTAPGELEIVRQFLNTYDVEEETDSIGDPDALSTWLSAHGLEAGKGLGPADVARAIAMREALRALTLANNGEPLVPEAISKLNAVAGQARLQVRFGEDGEPALEPAEEGGEAALGELLAIVFRSMAQGTWARLKACREHTCQWAFYDLSRNRSATWCSMAVCGNRAKARAYRARHRPQA
jgi:predicted RNA-binding Zn ribbon-like protein